MVVFSVCAYAGCPVPEEEIKEGEKGKGVKDYEDVDDVDEPPLHVWRQQACDDWKENHFY